MDTELARTFVEMLQERGMTFQRARLTLEFAIKMLERLPISALDRKDEAAVHLDCTAAEG